MVKVKRLHEDAVIPKYAKPGDSGFDLVAVEDVIIEPGETKVIPTGLAFEIPNGYEMQVRPRSGISRKTKLRVVLGTIDSGYRGEVGVIVDNASIIEYASQPRFVAAVLAGDGDFNITKPVKYETIKIRKGDRIAQGVLAAVGHTTFEEVEELSESERGEDGYGSTGMDISRQLEFDFEKGGVK
ncbi:deoxyuridine 5'-triphosphate nucleotidohydrolase [Bacillus wiedmannii]|uniref:dUTP diphosphatase n=1 Tax=Bacillus wiedmannii TaxID=1890302 RepID=UPI000BF45A79|nr:deoxyuridine 5'-triphosphate nucleotidohydrolase [Bacillus wiedmannii]PEU21347.1 deoxyuridine 5'-triphosphate nucleotidohydrolase [Bacillus wiedmannii]